MNFHFEVQEGTVVILQDYNTFCLYFSESVNCMLKAIEIYTDMGKFVMAAKHHQSIGEIYETEVGVNDDMCMH